MTEPVKALISADAGSFSLSRSAVEDLNQRRPELFYGPLRKQGFQLADLEPEEALLRRYWNAVIRNDRMYFLEPEDPRLRTDPVLVARLESGEESELRGTDCQNLGLVSLPDDVEWYVFVHEDGSEAICEIARMWPPEKNPAPPSTQLSFRDALHTRAWLGDRDVMFELAKKLGYPYFLWNGLVHKVENDTTYRFTNLTVDNGA